MRDWQKRLLRLVGVLLAIPLLLYVALWLWIGRKERPSEIVDFAPVDFEAKAERAFFYSIGSSLKYGNAIDVHAPTLITGDLGYVKVSPDNQRALVTINDTLYVVAANGSGAKPVFVVGGRYGQQGSPGQRFLDDDTYAWSADSRSVFYILDEYPMRDSVRRYSEKGELHEFDVASGRSRLIADRFPGYEYAVTETGEVYSLQSDGAGGAVYVHRKGNDSRHVRAKDRKERGDFTAVVPEGTGLRVATTTRYAPRDMIGDRLTGQRRPDKSLELRFDEKTILVVTQGFGFKGPYHCLSPSGDWLPGDRYVVLSARCGNHRGKLMVDVETGRYRTLPSHTRVYPPVHPVRSR